MDRHDLRGLKADDVAEAHRRDVDIQDRHGVKYMAYWFDESNGAAFCLVHAPDPATADASETLSVRIGIDAGEPVEDHNDLFGSTVQLASRLCSEAEANGIIVSGFALELCQEEDAARFVALGERRFKGFADKAQVFRFEWRE